MKRIWLLALNDLRLTVRDRAAFIWMLAMPIAMMWFMGGLGGRSDAPPRVALGVINQDDGWLSRALIDELGGEAIVLSVIDPAAKQEESARVRTLIVPAGFTSGALAGVQQSLAFEKEPGSNAQFGVAAEVHIIRAIVRTLGRLAEMSEEGRAATSDEASLATFRELGLRENLVTLSVSTAGRGRPVIAGRAQSVPGVLTFIVMMMTLIYGGVFLTIEKSSGMLLRQAVLPMTRGAVFRGKLLGRTLLAGLQVVILVLAGRFLFGVSWGDSPAALLLLLASFVFAIGALSTLLGAVLRTPAQASSVGWIGSMIMAALGGCWWPSEVMPARMQSFAHVFPTAWAMDGFHALISFGYGVPEILLPAAMLTGYGVLFTVLGSRFLRFER